MSKKEIDPQLKKYVQDNIIPQYKGFETSHNDEHIKTVIENSFDIVEELQLDVDPDMVYVIAAYHDIGIPLGRDRHHITSAEIMFKDKNLDRWFSEEEKKMIKEAIEDHRASNSLPPRSIYGKIVAEADRDIEPLRIVKRCVQYETAAHPLATKAEISSHIKNHLNEKYGEEGYLKLWLSTKKNRTGLDVLRRWIRSGEIEKYVDELMKENKYTYETERLGFRPWTIEDAEECFGLSSNEHVGPPCGWEPHKSLDETKEILQSILINDHTYCIIEKSSGKIIGNMGIDDIHDPDVEPRENERELGFWLGYPYWNKGYMTEAVKGTIEYCFNVLGLSKLWCGYFSYNAASGRVQEKCGFKHAYTKEHFKTRLGQEVELVQNYLERS